MKKQTGICWGKMGAKQKTFHGGSMDIFWNCTISNPESSGFFVSSWSPGETLG